MFQPDRKKKFMFSIHCVQVWLHAYVRIHHMSRHTYCNSNTSTLCTKGRESFKIIKLIVMVPKVYSIIFVIKCLNDYLQLCVGSLSRISNVSPL